MKILQKFWKIAFLTSSGKNSKFKSLTSRPLFDGTFNALSFEDSDYVRASPVLKLSRFFGSKNHDFQVFWFPDETTHFSKPP